MNAATKKQWRYGAMSNAVIDERGRLIASLDGRDSDGEDVLRADGVLLAAAPLMAEALKAARSSIDVSLIRQSAKATAHWERIAGMIDAALAAAKVQR